MRVKLSKTERRLFKVFKKNPNRVLARKFLIEMVWGKSKRKLLDNTRNADWYVGQLRLKKQLTIKPIYGVGYKYITPDKIYF